MNKNYFKSFLFLVVSFQPILAPLPVTVTHRAECSSRINTVAYTPNGNKFATGCQDGTAAIWNPVNGSRIANLSAQNSGGSGVNSMSWSHDSNFLAATFDNGVIFIWRADGVGLPSAIPEAISGLRFNAVNWSPKNMIFATSCSVIETEPRLLSAEVEEAEFSRPEKGILKIWSLTITPNFSAAPHEDSWLVTVCEINSRTDLSSGPISTFAWSQDGNMLATGSKTGDIMITDPNKVYLPDSTKNMVIHSPNYENTPSLIWFENEFLIQVYKEQIRIQFKETKIDSASIKFESTRGESLSWSSEKKWLAISFGTFVKIWDIVNIKGPFFLNKIYTPLLTELNNQLEIIDISWSSSGNYLVVNSVDGVSTVWRFEKTQASIVTRFFDENIFDYNIKNSANLIVWSGNIDGLIVPRQNIIRFYSFSESNLDSCPSSTSVSTFFDTSPATLERKAQDKMIEDISEGLCSLANKSIQNLFKQF